METDDATADGGRPESVPKGALVGKRVEIFWARERRWFSALAAFYDEEEDRYRLDYDDGDKEIIDIEEEMWRYEDDKKSAARPKVTASQRKAPKPRTTFNTTHDDSFEPFEVKAAEPPAPTPAAVTRKSAPAKEDQPKQTPPAQLPKVKRPKSAPRPGPVPQTAQPPPAMARINGEVAFLKSQFLEVRDSIGQDQSKSANEYNRLNTRISSIEQTLTKTLKTARDSYDSAVKSHADAEKKAKAREQSITADLAEAKSAYKALASRLDSSVEKSNRLEQSLKTISEQLKEMSSKATVPERPHTTAPKKTQPKSTQTSVARPATTPSFATSQVTAASKVVPFQPSPPVQRPPAVQAPVAASTSPSALSVKEIGKKAWLTSLICSLVNVWLLENPHEPVPKSIKNWSSETTRNCFLGIQGFLGRFVSVVAAKTSFEGAAAETKVEETDWLTKPALDPTFTKVRRNYQVWNPPPTDAEWACEKVLLLELQLKIAQAISTSSWSPQHCSIGDAISIVRQADALVLNHIDLQKLATAATAAGVTTK